MEAGRDHPGIMIAVRATAHPGRARRARVARLVLAWAVLVAGLVATPGTATAADGPNCADASGWTKTDGLVKEAHPVVLIHGWTGSALSDLRTRLERQVGSGWQFLLFDYHGASTQWAASRDASGCLVRYLKQVSDAHRAKGGDGLVYVVAHSMGGLATMFAAQDPSLTHRIGGLVSIGTPYEGSPWGNAKLGSVSYGKLLEALAGLGFTDIPPYAAPARTCLAMHDGAQGMPDGCQLAPYLPKDVAVHEIGGILTVRRTFFGIHAYDMPMGGDTIVPISSSQGYLGSAGKPNPVGIKVGLDSVACTMDASTLIAQAGARNVLTALPSVWGQMWVDSAALDAVLADKASPALIELLAAADIFGSCSHAGLLTNDAAVADVVKALKAQVAWQKTRRNVTAAILNTAEVPANCDMPRQRLVGGTTTKRNKDASPYAQGSLRSSGHGSVAEFGDLAGLGYKQALDAYSCTAGGVSWPQTLVLVGEGGTMLAAFDLGSIGQAEHADVESIAIKGDRATVRWRSYEGAGYDIVDHTSTVRYQNGALKVTGVYPATFTLGADRFGPLTLPTSPDVALREVKPYLGKPTTDLTEPGCPIASPTMQSRTMTWGDLRLYGEYDGLDLRQITAWTLHGTNTPMPLSLPYSITIGTSYVDLKRAVSGYVVDDSRIFSDGLVITKGDLSWWLDSSDTKVATIMAHTLYCE